jgi:hypothetical protein
MIMMLATPIAPARRATVPRPRNKGVERALGLGAGGEGVRGAGDVDLAGAFRVRLGAEQFADSGDGGLGAGGADVDLRGVPVEAQVLLGGGEADQDGGVDLGGVGVGVENAGDVEPLAGGAAGADQIRMPGRTRSMPSRWAMVAPSTATGWRAVAALR